MPGGSGIYKFHSFLQHSCEPNCAVGVLFSTGDVLVRALRRISAGEVLTRNYEREGHSLGWSCIAQSWQLIGTFIMSTCHENHAIVLRWFENMISTQILSNLYTSAIILHLHSALCTFPYYRTSATHETPVAGFLNLDVLQRHEHLQRSRGFKCLCRRCLVEEASSIAEFGGTETNDWKRWNLHLMHILEGVDECWSERDSDVKIWHRCAWRGVDIIGWWWIQLNQTNEYMNERHGIHEPAAGCPRNDWGRLQSAPELLTYLRIKSSQLILDAKFKHQMPEENKLRKLPRNQYHKEPVCLICPLIHVDEPDQSAALSKNPWKLHDATPKRPHLASYTAGRDPKASQSIDI